MPIANQESTLAAELGVSGTVTRSPGLYPVTPLSMVWRRQIEPADSLLSALTTQGGIALAERTVAVKEGQWVTLDSTGKAVVAADATTLPCWPVWSGGDRLDPKGGLTVLHGPFVADTSYFDKDGSYAVGTLLQIGTANVQGVAAQAGCLTPVTISAVGDVYKVVARVERTPFGVGSEIPNGALRIQRIAL